MRVILVVVRNKSAIKTGHDLIDITVTVPLGLWMFERPGEL